MNGDDKMRSLRLKFLAFIVHEEAAVPDKRSATWSQWLSKAVHTVWSGLLNRVGDTCEAIQAGL